MLAPPPTTTPNASAATTLTAATAASSTTAASGHAKRPDAHRHRRRFIGPMPEKALLQQVAETNQRKRSRLRLSRTRANTKQDEEIVQEVVREHALDYFLGHGGNIEDWNEEEDERVRDLMLKRWKDSEWGRARKAVQWDTAVAKKWIGASFDVGVFLGVNLLDETASRSFRASAANTITSSSRIRDKGRSDASDTFVTARSALSDSSNQDGNSVPPVSGRLGEPSGSSAAQSLLPEPAPSPNRYSYSAGSADSTTALLDPKVSHPSYGAGTTSQSNVLPKSTILRTPSRARDSNALGDAPKPKGKAPRVHYADMQVPGDESPAPPIEVLARRGSDMPNTSAEAARHATAENEAPWGEAIMRGTHRALSSSTSRPSAERAD